METLLLNMGKIPLAACCKVFLALILACVHGVGAEAHDLDSIYAVLDTEVANSEKYIAEKEKQLNGLTETIKKSRSDEERYELTRRLYEELSSFDNARAKDALHECLALAKKLGSYEKQADAYSCLAYQNSATGYYKESLDWLAKIDERKLTSRVLPFYYFVCTHVYGELGRYSDDASLGQEYYRQSDFYRDKFFAVADHASSVYRQRMVSSLLGGNRLAEADSLCRSWEHTIGAASRDYAIMAYYRSEICHIRNDVDGQCYWLARSAISDCRNAVTNQAALWSLAQLMSTGGDLKRSRTYMEYSWMFASKFGGHTRSWQISPIIIAMNENYHKELSDTNRNLTALLALVSVLAILFLVSLLFLYKRNHQLYVARNQLGHINDKLASLNRQLHESNDKKNQVNQQLRDSNRVKDEYIAQFLSLCSKYIDKMDAFRMKVNRRLKAGQYKELQSMTGSEEMREEEAKELFANFDAVFLRLYPNFVEQFNSLLRPECHQSLGPNNELTTDMRMAALIRLGVDDSSSIAEFLRLSPNTIYNYRARLKSRSAGDRDTFEERIKEIGL